MSDPLKDSHPPAAAEPVAYGMKARTTGKIIDAFHSPDESFTIPLYAAPSITITLRQAEALIESFGGDGDSEVTVTARAAGEVSMDAPDEVSPAGLWAHCTGYPEEGSVYLGPTEIDEAMAAAPSPQPTQQAAPAVQALTEQLIELALDSDASGRPALTLADAALSLRAALTQGQATQGERE